MSAVKARASNTIFTNRTPSPSTIIANINNFDSTKEIFQTKNHQQQISNLNQQYYQNVETIDKKNSQNLNNIRWRQHEQQQHQQQDVENYSNQNDVGNSHLEINVIEYKDQVPSQEQQQHNLQLQTPKTTQFEYSKNENSIERQNAQYNRLNLHQNISLVDTDEVMKDSTTDPILNQYSVRHDEKVLNHNHHQHHHHQQLISEQINKSVNVYQNHQQLRHLNQHNFDMNAAYAESPQPSIQSPQK